MDERTRLEQSLYLASQRLREANEELMEAEKEYGVAARALDAFEEKRAAHSAGDSNG
jgi:hypothetical protein